MQQQKSIEQINTNKNLFFMSLPIFVELMLQLLVGNIDQIMVSRVSQNSVASIVNANIIMNLVIIVLSMAASATTVILSQYIGAKDKLNSSRTAMVSFVMIGAIGAAATLAVFLCYKPVFNALHVPDEIYDETKRYLLVVSAFILIQGIYLNLSSILRTYTLMKEVMYVSVVMNVLNIAGNAVLINGWFGMPRMGALGAAVSTDISKVIGLVLLVILYKRKVNISLGFKYLKPFPTGILKNLCMLAIPSGAESLSYNMSQMCIQGIINTFGTITIITKGYCTIFANLSYVYSMALAQATQIVLGYLIGAKMIDAIQRRVNATKKVALAAGVGIAIVLFLSSNWIFLMFTDNPEVIALGRRILFIEIILEAGRAINIVMTRCLVAVGDIKTPTFVGIIFQWCVAFLGAYVLGDKLNLGLEGVWIAMAADECIRGIIFAIHFKREKWKSVFRSAA